MADNNAKPVNMPKKFKSVRPWTPSDVSTAAWYDASDENTITESGGAVSQWDDKSGNARHATQGVGSYQPSTGVDNINGINVLTLTDPLRHKMYTTAFTLPTNHAIFAVIEHGVAAADARYLLAHQSAFLPDLYFGAYDAKFGVKYGSPYTAPDAGDNVVPEHDTLNTPTQVSVVNDGTTATPYADGSQKDAVNGVHTQMTSGLVVGGSPSLGNNFVGKIAEIIITDSDIDDGTRERLEGYLAHKWGLEANLPVDHPYKDSIPYI